MDRFPRTISFTRRGGTLISRASLFWLRPRGFRNSSSRTSPGWTFDSVSGMTSPLSGSPRSVCQGGCLPYLAKLLETLPIIFEAKVCRDSVLYEEVHHLAH